MADKKTKIIIETESGNSEQKLKNISKDLQQISNVGKSTSFSIKQSTSSMTSSFIALGAKVAAVTVTIKKAYSMARDAAQFQEIALYTKAATENIGLSFERLKEASERGANGMADSVTIMKANLKALKQGLNATEEEIGQLWKIANATGDELGQSIEQTFEQIVQAINTGNGRALIQLGVLPENFKRSADSAELLANKGKLLKTVLDQLGTSADRLGKYGDTAFDKFQQLENAFSDLKLAASEGLVPALVPVVEMLTDIVKTATKATSAISTLAGLKKTENPYLSLSKDEIEKRINTARNKIATLSYVPGSDPSRSYRDAGGQGGYGSYLGQAGLTNSTNKGELEHYQQVLNKLLEAREHLNNLAQKEAEAQKKIADQAEKTELEKAAKLQEQEFEKMEREAERRREKERQERERILALLQRQREEEERAFKAFANLADSTMPQLIKTEEDAYLIALNFAKAAGGIAVAFNKAEASAKELEQAESWAFTEKQAQNAGYWNNFIKKDNKEQINDLINTTIGLSGITGLNISKIEIPEVAKKGWSAIQGQVIEGFSEAVTSGIINSNLGDALRGAISSIAASKAQSYGSNILGSLFSGGKIATGALSGFVGSIAISAIANNWKKWFGDKNKSETMASNASTKERGSNAYLQTYAAMLNPFMTDEQYWNLLDSRYASSGMYVSWKSSRRGGLAGLAGGKNYTDTTPQYTYDLINAMEKAVDAVKEYNDKKEKELDLLSAQGYDYRVLSEQLGALSDAVDRANWMSDTYSHSWSSGEKYSIDLSDNIQDLKKAYYEALREYGEETGARNQQKASTFMSLFPYLDDYNLNETTRYNGKMTIRGNNLNDSASFMLSEIGYVQENLLDRFADPKMLEMIKQAGKEQFELAELQYVNPELYSEKYLDVLERQRDAAYLVMQEQEAIYRDMTKTFEEQSAALETYQQAQDQYYSTRLEIMAQERAKEEQIKKEEQQARLRSTERIESLLGFTGEIARTGNKIYILEGADQVGALRELEQQIDDPEALAIIQRLTTYAQNKNKFGKI